MAKKHPEPFPFLVEIFSLSKTGECWRIGIRQTSLTQLRGKISPRGFLYTGNLALISKLPEAYTADAVVTQIGVGTSADLAPVVLTGGELGASLLL